MRDGYAAWSGQTIQPSALGSPSVPLWYETAAVGQRLASVLDQAALQDEQTQQTLAFLHGHWQQAMAWHPTAGEVGGTGSLLDRLCRQLKLSADERLLLILAGMAEEHEGFVASFVGLHPRGEPFPTVGLFARLACQGLDRGEAWRLLTQSALLRLGLVRVVGEGAWPERSLRLADGVWAALQGLINWPVPPLQVLTRLDDGWLRQSDVCYLTDRLQSRQALMVALQGEPLASHIRLAQWLAGLGPRAVCFEVAGQPEGVVDQLLQLCLIHDRIPVWVGNPGPSRLLGHFPWPMLCAEADPAWLASLPMPVLPVAAPRPSRALLAALWQESLPELAEQAPELAARFPLEPRRLWRVQGDARALAGLTPLDAGTAYTALKTRLARGGDSQMRRVTPRAGWDDLILPEPATQALHNAVARLRLQSQVLDDWGFDRGDTSRRGLRLLFCGLPGTGKTLAAEVMALALHAELLVIDLSRTVSKWIGETEKNLAAIFDEAEATRGVLFFDEADALFAKRTDVHDANDRFANIETAYLLTRLERFDGIAILATNLRQHIDKAFLRRFEFVIDFPEPGADERAAIWRRHVPAQAPLADGVDFELLALRYPMSGAMIRNALLGAAYEAAATDGPISQSGLERAIALEFEKTGRLCP
ncbi:hypothetical protein HNQ59_002444 [Chitinivorax tropicus]|uniref:AAA+ ATPase domain-containing protein n=1 Tax=Chitinivorax tropicus TaxID=714531 RepID=A0A840MRT7_9PROT|nr:AAA family ATPase [Chitinivorax tropicus]MBB5019146.1 hypothetical protein [Chitinivorax tropicus]